ncbi:TonB-dependent receptor [Sphingomonas nostoxanthinifaciens]|uniref:TonB-dependent receptor n=1 Tax=Sphingomonas nostoxanthinifaciens TaxID=2872652 RepID=UPI001CC2158A|nr:TonB-dependent receptor [Sphingomonas nostoxanthinifaciens]UAK23347.1 TonB-dependent receptor [Sphingomonas nostoxanthinifaciens]
MAFDIQSADLAGALNEVGRQSGMQISFPFDRVAGHRVAPLKGTMPAADAVRRLIAGTALTIGELTDEHILLIQGAATGTEPAEAGNDILVTGLRLANRRALESKRNTNQIIDAVSQDDVAQLPDVNIVEAARRIPGISVVSDRDSSRGHDNYQYVTIRGLDSRYNLVTVDGAQIASADSSYRGAQLAVLPASLVSEIQVIKTVTAQYDPHALGGQLNLVTKSAFDTGNYFTAQALGGWTSQTGKVVPDARANIRASGTGAVLFGADKQFGFVLSGEYQRLDNSARATLPGDTGGAGWTYYTAAGAQTGDIPNSTGVAVPVRVQDYAFVERRERYSVNAKLEYRPSDRFGISLFGGYYHETSAEDRYEALGLPAAAYTPGATPDTGALKTANYQFGLVTQPESRRTWLINGNAHYDLTDRLKLSAGLSDSNAHYNQDRWMYKWNTGMNEVTGSTTNLPQYGYSYSVTGGQPTITLNDQAAASIANNYQPRYWRHIVYNIDNKVRAAHGELAWNNGAEDRGFGADIGFSRTLTNVLSRADNHEWYAANPASALLIGNLDQYSQATVLNPLTAPGLPFYLIDAGKANAVLMNHPEWFRSVDHTADIYAAYYRLRESITAGYGQVNWRSDAVYVQAGLRYDTTDVSVDNYTRTTASGVTTYPLTQRNKNYAYPLPSALAIWNVTERMKLRGSVSKTIGRPDYGQYGATTTMTLDTSNSATPLTISQGNPDLKPRQSWNYDVSYEWYFAPGSLFSAGLFLKNIRDEIFTKSTIGSGVYNGVTYAAMITQPVNGSKAGVKGAEIQLIKDKLDFLPGPLRNLGVSINATWLDGHFDFSSLNSAGTLVTRRVGALINQPDHIYNASLFYVGGPISARIAFNRIGASPVSVDSNYSWRDIWADERDQIDLQASYRIKPWLEVTSEVQNLTNTSFEAHLGPHRGLLQTRYPVGRTVWFGLVFRPNTRG